jgi:hypothetical protein
MTTLLSAGETNAKLAKASEGIDATIQYLEPIPDFCRGAANAGCMTTCITTSGMMPMHVLARLRRNAIAHQEEIYAVQIRKELTAQQKRADRNGDLAVHRNDGTSDRGYAIKLAPEFPRMIFYDYTKILGRALKYSRGEYAPNYHLTFSFGKNTSTETVSRLLALNVNVAVVFPEDAPLPTTWRGHRVIDGTVSDWRWRDPVGVIVGLSAKGDAKGETGGFVVRDQ